MTWHIVFRSTALAALFAAFIQITLGGIVRITGSGLGCPDWPLCHGEIIPPFEVDIFIEYSHRLSGTILGLLVFATAILAWRLYRSDQWLVVGSMVGLVAVITAGVLGGATVLTGLSWWVRLVHLAVAEILIAAMVIVNVGAWQVTQGLSVRPMPLEKINGSKALLLVTVVGVFILTLSGSYMVGYGAGSACATWPLCRGTLLPQETPYAIHMGHRLLSVVMGLLVIATVFMANCRGIRIFPVGWLGHLLLMAFAMQVLVGAGIVWTGFEPVMKGIHLSLATVVWIALLFMAAFMIMRERVDPINIYGRGIFESER